MDTSRQLPTHGDGLLDMREPARTLLESMVNEVMDAQADMPCGDGANALRIPKLRAGTYLPEGVIERYPRAGVGGGRGCRGVVGERRLDEEDGADRPQDGHGEALEGPGRRHVRVA